MSALLESREEELASVKETNATLLEQLRRVRAALVALGLHHATLSECADRFRGSKCLGADDEARRALGTEGEK